MPPGRLLAAAATVGLAVLLVWGLGAGDRQGGRPEPAEPLAAADPLVVERVAPASPAAPPRASARTRSTLRGTEVRMGEDLVVFHADRPELRWFARAGGHVPASGPVQPDAILQVELLAGTEARVQVRDAEDDRPLAGAVFRAEDGTVRARTDADGWAWLDTERDAGELTAELPGYLPRPWPADRPSDPASTASDTFFRSRSTAR